MRKVRYRDTGEWGSSDEGFKGADGKYYSSEKAYKVIKADKDAYKEIYLHLQEILEIPEKPVPPIIIKELKQYKGHYSVVLAVLRQVGETIREGLCSRHIESSFHAAKYIAAFINNQYRSVERELESCTEIREQDYEPLVDISDRGHKNRHKDLSKLIGEI